MKRVLDTIACSIPDADGRDRCQLPVVPFTEPDVEVTAFLPVIPRKKPKWPAKPPKANDRHNAQRRERYALVMERKARQALLGEP